MGEPVVDGTVVRILVTHPVHELEDVPAGQVGSGLVADNGKEIHHRPVVGQECLVLLRLLDTSDVFGRRNGELRLLGGVGLRRVPLALRLRVDCSLAEFRLLVDEGNLGFVRKAANAPGTFAVALVPDEIEILAGGQVNQLFRWVTVPSGTANVES